MISGDFNFVIRPSEPPVLMCDGAVPLHPLLMAGPARPLYPARGSKQPTFRCQKRDECYEELTEWLRRKPVTAVTLFRDKSKAS
jgi:hypothetical protein